MNKNENKIKALEKWGQELIENFRIEYETLDELEKSHIPNDRDYRFPCQIEFFWVLEPIEYQLFITIHDNAREDGEIIINGPFPGNELIPKTIEIMNEPRWKKKVANEVEYPFQEGFEIVGYQENKYSDIFLPNIANFINHLRMDPTINFKKSILAGQIMGSNGWCTIIKGNIVELETPDSLVIDSIKEAKQQANFIRERKETELPQGKSENNEKEYLELIGAYYYPGVRIGDNLELTFEEKLINSIGSPIYLPEVDYNFTFNNKKGFLDTFGFVGIHAKNENEALKILNTIYAVSLIFGFDSISVRESELFYMNMNSNSSSVGRFSWHSMGDTRRPSPYTSHGIRKVAIPLETMKTIIETAERISHNENLNELVLFLLESFTHFYDSEYSQSFLYSWLIVENHMTRLFNEMLSDKKVSSERKKKFYRHDKWSSESKIEVLNFTGKIDADKYTFLIKYNTKRNKFAHEGKNINEDESKKLFDFSKKIIKYEIDNQM